MAAKANTGSGGSGGNDNTNSGGGGGGAGEFVEALIAAPAATYTFTVGAAGSAALRAATAPRAASRSRRISSELRPVHRNSSAQTVQPNKHGALSYRKRELSKPTEARFM